MANETYKKGLWESDYVCPECGEYAVEGYYWNEQMNPHLIWFDCLNCSHEFDGERPTYNLPNWHNPNQCNKCHSTNCCNTKGNENGKQ